MFYRYIVLAIVGWIITGCTTTTVNGVTTKSIDPNAVALAQQVALATCAFTPTAQQIVDLYTNNPAVKTTEAAVAILCGTVSAKILVVPAAPVTTPVPATGG